MNYAFFSLWLALGFSGWIIACSGLSALQRYENHSGISVLGRMPACVPSSFSDNPKGRSYTCMTAFRFQRLLTLCHAYPPGPE